MSASGLTMLHQIGHQCASLFLKKYATSTSHYVCHSLSASLCPKLFGTARGGPELALCRTMLDYAGLFRIIVGLCRIMSDCVGLCRTIAGLCRTISDYFGLFRTISGLFSDYVWTIPDYFGLFRIISDYLGLFRTISDYFGTTCDQKRCPREYT